MMNTTIAILPFDIPDFGTIFCFKRCETIADICDMNYDVRLDWLDETFEVVYSEDELIEKILGGSFNCENETPVVFGEFVTTWFSEQYKMEDCSWTNVNACVKFHDVLSEIFYNYNMSFECPN